MAATATAPPQLGDRLSADFLAEQRRRRIIHATAVAVVEHGYCATSVSDIVRCARTARNTFYDTFGSKEAAARALVSETFPVLAEQVDLDPIEGTGLGVLAVELAAGAEAGERQSAIHAAAYVCRVLGDLYKSVRSIEGPDELRCSLPPGRHGLPENFVRRNQRHRLLTALATAVAQKGYHPTTLADVTRLAKVSRRTFYEHFASKETAAIALALEASELGAALLLENGEPNSGLEALVIEVVAAGVDGGPSVAAATAGEATIALGVLPEVELEAAA